MVVPHLNIHVNCMQQEASLQAADQMGGVPSGGKQEMHPYFRWGVLLEK